VAIAEQYLQPNALKDTGLSAEQIMIEESATKQLIRGYCREAGVRNLQQHFEKLMRKIALKVVKNEADTPEIVTAENLTKLVGQPVFNNDRLYPIDDMPPGVVLGLAWTSLGGSTLFVESVRGPPPPTSIDATDGHSNAGSGSVRGTGQLGDVMQESVVIAHSFAKRYLHKLDPDNTLLVSSDIHLHVPEGSTPKDGPSAGITMVTALLSLAMEKPVIPGLAMTGELSLTGRVLPIGGVKEKTIAARRDSITQIILPEGNRKDWDELADDIVEGMHVNFVSSYDQVYSVAFAQ